MYCLNLTSKTQFQIKFFFHVKIPATIKFMIVEKKQEKLTCNKKTIF